MPQAEGGYVSLEGTGTNNNGQSIYQSTTEPTGPVSVFESVKRAIGQVVGANNAHDSDDLLNNSGRQPVIIGSSQHKERITSSYVRVVVRPITQQPPTPHSLPPAGRDRDKTGKTLNTKMPSAPAHTAEEARLLGTMPVDPMDDIELRSVQLQFPHARSSIVDSCDQRRIPTDKGDILVAIQGDTSKPAILTYHDLGLNYATSFAGFFNFPLMRGLLENFCVYHVTAPGQEEGAPTLPEDYIYPTMEELANQLQFVLSHFGLKSVIGFGIGAGANILARFALSHPDKVGAMCLINCVSTQSGWIEWGYQSFNARFLRTKGMTQGVIDYLMWHHFGRNPEERNHDLVQVYKQHFERGVNPTNLAMLINSYIHRNDLNISRTPPGTPGTEPSAATLKMPIMNITGALSPHVDDTVTFNGRLDPTNSTWMKISDCAMVLEEQPSKLAEAFRLFLQGEGYATPLSTPASSPCGTKYLSYSNIFFANFKEEQERILAEKLKQHQQPPARIRTNTRLCRETAINNNNESTAQDTLSSTQQQQQDSAAMDNGNETANNISSSYDSNNPDLLDNLNAGEEEEECSLNKHSIKGALYTAAAVASSTNAAVTATTTTGQSKKIRITENPLPEPVSC